MIHPCRSRSLGFFFVDFEDVFVGVEPKIGGFYPPKWMVKSENNGNTYFLMDDLGVPLYLETPICR